MRFTNNMALIVIAVLVSLITVPVGALTGHAVYCSLNKLPVDFGTWWQRNALYMFFVGVPIVTIGQFFLVALLKRRS